MPYTFGMRLEINGESKDVGEVETVAQLLRTLGLDRAPCAVEVNARLVPKAQHPQQPLRAGDRVEIVTLVGGG